MRTIEEAMEYYAFGKEREVAEESLQEIMRDPQIIGLALELEKSKGPTLSMVTRAFAIGIMIGMEMEKGVEA